MTVLILIMPLNDHSSPAPLSIVCVSSSLILCDFLFLHAQNYTSHLFYCRSEELLCTVY